jgi:hypothetical protein
MSAMNMIRTVSAALCLLTAACSARGVCTGLYEGARVKNQLDTPPSERFGKPELPADYQQYEMMRRETIQRNGQSSP